MYTSVIDARWYGGHQFDKHTADIQKMADRRNRQDQLIEALYDLALDPNNFDSFTEAWEQYLQDNLSNAEPESEVSERLSRHFGRAFEILEKIGRENTIDNQAIDELVETRNSPSIGIKLDGRILKLNKGAEKLFGPFVPEIYLQDLVDVRSRPSLSKGLSHIASGQSLPVMVLLPNSQPVLMLLQRQSYSDTVIIDVTGATWDAHMHSTLQTMYSLTETECSIASLLYRGFTINEIAERENRALDTVRQHAKSLLKKTETHSQPRLMRLLTSFSFTQGTDEPSKWANSKCANHIVKFPDGRNYAYYDSGTKHKKVIVVLHGVLHDPELPDIMHHTLSRDGYRIIGPSRAWFGESSPPLSTDNLLANSAADLIAMLDHLNLETVILLGNMGGAAHAYATAALYPDRVERIINIAGMAPLSSERQIKSMPKSLRAVVRTAKHFPKLLPTLMRTALALIDNGDIRKLFETSYRNSPLDIAATKRDDIFQRLYIGYRFAAHHGYAAYTHEGLALAQDLSHYLDRVTCSCSLIHGVHDGITSLEAVNDLARTQANMRVTPVDDAGHLIMYTNPKTATQALMKSLLTPSN